MTQIKNSKIKQVHSVSEPYGQYNTLYHNLEMENGDKINIGKKSTQQKGWEVWYQITDTSGQQEFAKAKSVQKPEQTNGGGNAYQTTQTFKQDPDKSRSIEMQVCLKEAVQHHSMHGFKFAEKDDHIMEVCTTAQTFYDQLFKPNQQ